jgi:hypothetical protein
MGWTIEMTIRILSYTNDGIAFQSITLNISFDLSLLFRLIYNWINLKKGKIVSSFNIHKVCVQMYLVTLLSLNAGLKSKEFLAEHN